MHHHCLTLTAVTLKERRIYVLLHTQCICTNILVKLNLYEYLLIDDVYELFVIIKYLTELHVIRLNKD